MLNICRITDMKKGYERGVVETARADFNLRELPCYLSNTYETLPLLLKFIGEQGSGKRFCQEYKLLTWQPDFRHHVQSNFDFFDIFSFN